MPRWIREKFDPLKVQTVVMDSSKATLIDGASAQDEFEQQLRQLQRRVLIKSNGVAPLSGTAWRKRAATVILEVSPSLVISSSSTLNLSLDCIRIDPVRRREFIALFTSAAVSWPLTAHAQQQPGKMWRIGLITHGYVKSLDGLFEGLRELGYVEGQNIVIERRYAEGKAERFQEFAEEMVRLKVDIIIVFTTPTALAAKKRPRRFRSYFPPPLIR